MSRLFVSVFIFLSVLSCSPHWSVHQINTKNIQVNVQTSSIDSLVELMVKPFRDSISNDMSKLVAVSASPLVKDKPESKLTNLIADIILKYGRKYCISKNPDVTPDASYVNYGGLRASLPKGKITLGHVFELMPFENELVLIRISGDSLVQMAERIAERGGEGIGGMKMGIRNGKSGTLTVGGKSVDPALSYWLVTNDYIANGGDQMSMFLNPFERIDTKLKIRDLLIQDMSEQYRIEGILDFKVDGRIFNEH